MNLTTTSVTSVWATSIFLTLLFGVAVIPSNVSAGTMTNEQSSATGCVKPFSFLFYPTNASPEVIRLAKQFTSTYAINGPLPSPGNPACCVWLEVKPSHSRPGVPYYSVCVFEAGETFIYASSEELLEKSMDRLKANSHNESGQWMVPVGAFSYYEN